MRSGGGPSGKTISTMPSLGPPRGVDSSPQHATRYALKAHVSRPDAAMPFTHARSNACSFAQSDLGSCFIESREATLGPALAHAPSHGTSPSTIVARTLTDPRSDG